jgi:hypothetical protein
MSASSVSRISPANMTGRKKAELTDANAEAIRQREGEISMINAAAAEEKEHGIIDLTEPRHIEVPVVVETESVEVEEPVREFRVNTKIEKMNVGAGNYYDFEEGRTYRVKKHVYDRLDELGYVWH